MKLRKITNRQLYNTVKVKEVFDSRWLSFEGAVEAVLRNLSSLIAALLQDKETGMLKLIGTYEFVAVTHFMTDVLAITGHLCKIFQKQNLDFTYANRSITSCVSALLELGNNPGQQEHKFLLEVPEEDG
jgi:hypothetical protein